MLKRVKRLTHSVFLSADFDKRKKYFFAIQGAPKVPAKCIQNKGKTPVFESQEFGFPCKAFLVEYL
jgi:hypothetical protein